MCGIAGFFNSQQNTEVLKSMISQLGHRGPDGFGIYRKDGTGLAHARLSIIDLEGGFQPIHNEDKTIWVVFNGEIFNYIELRRGFERGGHTFYTNSDTEVIVHLYEEHGPDFVKMLNGQFSIALWDENKQEGLLVRDRVGIQPLFYTRSWATLWFGSEIKSLFAVPGIPRELDRNGIAQTFTYWSPLHNNTAFDGINELPPGHILHFNSDKTVHIEQYWDHRYDISNVDGDYVSEAYNHLMRSTSLRLRSDVPVAAYLSGGLDSSMIAAMVHQLQPEQLRTFSIEFEDKQFDESEYQKQMIDRLGVDHTSFRCTYQDVADIFPEVVFHAEQPILRTAPAPMMLLSRMVRENGYKVVLTGEGADEAFAGYDIFRENLVRRILINNPDQVETNKELLRQLYPWMGDRISKSTGCLDRFFNGGTKDTGLFWFSHEPRWRTTARSHQFFADDLKGHVLGGRAICHLQPPFGATYLEIAQYIEFHTLFQGYLISVQGDRMLMANAVEGRFPFLDPNVIDFANMLPTDMKLRGMEEKYILKQVANGLVPDTIRQRKKQPYMAPDASSFFCGDRCPEYVDDVLSPSVISNYGYFNPMKVALLRKKLEKGAKGFADNMAFVGILSTQLLHQQFVESFVPKPTALDEHFVINVT